MHCATNSRRYLIRQGFGTETSYTQKIRKLFQAPSKLFPKSLARKNKESYFSRVENYLEKAPLLKLVSLNLPRSKLIQKRGRAQNRFAKCTAKRAI